jgi:hypothetical protein
MHTANSTLHPMVNHNTLVFHLEVPKDYAPTGIHDNLALFENEQGTVRKVQLPMYTEARCSVVAAPIRMFKEGKEDYEPVLFARHDPMGKFKTSISIDSHEGFHWAVVTLNPYTE